MRLLCIEASATETNAAGRGQGALGTGWASVEHVVRDGFSGMGRLQRLDLKEVSLGAFWDKTIAGGGK